MIQLTLSVSLFKDIHTNKDRLPKTITPPNHPSSSSCHCHCSCGSSTHRITDSKYTVRSSINVKGHLFNRFLRGKTKRNICAKGGRYIDLLIVLEADVE